MISTEEAESITTLIQYQHGFVISKVMFTACELGVFDLLLESGEPLSSTTIAECLGTSPHGMELLLGACVALKLLRTERKDEQVLYGNTDLSSLCLGKSSPKSQYHHMMWFSESIYMNLHYLADAVREGKNLNEKSLNSKKFYDGIYRSEEQMQRFVSCMNGTWSLGGRDVIAAFDLSQFPQICDLGGGGGALAKECIYLYPNCTVTILDLPEVVRTAKKHFISEEEQWIHFIEGDFFEDLIPEADLYILARICHNWTDEKCAQLLTKVYKACKPRGGVLIIEMVLNEDRKGPLLVHLKSILMLALTEGKERTPSEYSTLLSATGFKEAERKKTRLFDAILARK
ncbi:acetylserotonin O-methyltransferase-like [Eublepharis macularius]|uniref:Acetylserotonin O-methyltransferase n=1 Tax=Eublepharis macularius TaxID=481883 RepID=A0AA97J417_EUBMA|nr:acetylserotonin O-methyltransferase-like [Eublepharis macularius]